MVHGTLKLENLSELRDRTLNNPSMMSPTASFDKASTQARLFTTAVSCFAARKTFSP
jgi:hypothetical protein